MILTQDTVAKIIFTLSIGSYDGEVIEVVKEIEPFEFVYGKGVMLQSFENKLEGLKIGEEFKFMLPKEEAYGSYMPEMQIELEKQILIDQIADPEMIEEEIVVDNYIPMQDAEGNNLSGRITFIDDKIVKLDFNHPLADMDLYFVGKVLDLRPANAEEIRDGRVFEPTTWQDSGPDDPQTCGI
jgi:FKBP-type peptidyl-prolyl cis-trans isomerase SlyD